MPASAFMGIPGGNIGGTNMAIPGVGGSSTPAMGGASNPLIPSYPGGTASPTTTNFPANTGGGDPSGLLSALSGLNIGAGIGPGGPNQPGTYADALRGSFAKAGFGNPLAALIVQFLQGGAGFNPQVAQAMLAALQPQIQRGQANIMEQFGGAGLTSSSPAAIGLGDFLSQATLDEGQILSSMYEQSVQDYMNVLMAGRKPTSSQGGIGGMIGGLLSGGGDIMSGLGALGVGGGGGAPAPTTPSAGLV